MSTMSIFIILSVVLSLVATILAHIFIVPEKRRARLNKFGKFLHDTVRFKYLIIEKILQTVYILATAFVILLGFFMLFYVQPGYESYYYSTPSVWYGGYGLLIMLVGPIAVRLAYELIMMAILLVTNVIQINNKLKSGVEIAVKSEVESTGKSEEKVSVPEVSNIPAVEMDETPAYCFCRNCGAKITMESFCPHCGTKLQ